MNKEELFEFRMGFDTETLKLMATIRMMELHGLMMWVGENDSRIIQLTPRGRELADSLLEEEFYKNHALAWLDEGKKDSSNVDFVQ